MKRLLPLPPFLPIAMAAAVLVCSCEDHKNASDGGAPASSGAGAAATTVSGTWSGVSATSQVSSKLYLSETNGKITGSLAWQGDTRTVSGSRNGSAVTLSIGGGDTWKLTFSGDSLSGTGYKASGGTYSCSFSR